MNHEEEQQESLPPPSSITVRSLFPLPPTYLRSVRLVHHLSKFAHALQHCARCRWSGLTCVRCHFRHATPATRPRCPGGARCVPFPPPRPHAQLPWNAWPNLQVSVSPVFLRGENRPQASLPMRLKCCRWHRGGGLGAAWRFGGVGQLGCG